MTQRDIINLTDGIVSMKNENTMLKNTVQRKEAKIIELQILIDEFENSEGLIINTLDSPDLTTTEKINIIKDSF
tara:strand:+ start:6347 stop:6568 length:222 start_codon:yes stop_codon:yes gene_type:complete